MGKINSVRDIYNQKPTSGFVQVARGFSNGRTKKSKVAFCNVESRPKVAPKRKTFCHSFRLLGLAKSPSVSRCKNIQIVRRAPVIAPVRFLSSFGGSLSQMEEDLAFLLQEIHEVSTKRL